MLRRLLAASQRIQKSVHDRDGEPRDLVEQAERMMFEVAHDTAAQDFASLTDILVRETHRLEELAEGRRQLTGTPSGLIDLDNLTGGFQPGNLIIIAARPSMGKCLAGSSLVYDPEQHYQEVRNKWFDISIIRPDGKQEKLPPPPPERKKAPPPPLR